MSKIDPVLQEYVAIKKQIAELENHLESMKEQVMDIIEYNLEGNPDYVTSLGTFKIGGRNSYKYSSSIDSMQKALYEAKKKEEHDGTAELVKASSFPVFIPVREGRNNG